MTSDLQRWSREVAEDPGSSSFIQLARAYRRQGRREAARNVVLGGLRANPHHVGGHALLALLHIEAGEHESARDEWETSLRLAPGSFEASRGLGFLALERGDLSAARRHLEAARLARPADPAVQQAFEVLVRREGAEQTARKAERRRADRGADETEPAGQPGRDASAADAIVVVDTVGVVEAVDAEIAGAEAGSVGDSAGTAGVVDGRDAAGAAPEDGALDPTRLFVSLTGEGPLLGAVLLDENGLVLAGRIQGENGQDDLLGGLLSAAVGDAVRAAAIMGLGHWQGMLLETDELSLHVDAIEEGGDRAAVAVLTRPGTPAGWVVRVARRARELAVDYLREVAP